MYSQCRVDSLVYMMLYDVNWKMVMVYIYACLILYMILGHDCFEILQRERSRRDHLPGQVKSARYNTSTARKYSAGFVMYNFPQKL